MLTNETKDLLRQLRSGNLDVADATRLEQLSASGLISDLRNHYPVMFQERHTGRKQEAGMARSLRFEFAVRKLPGSRFPQVYLIPIFRRCLLVSSYEDSISEITMVASIRATTQGGVSGDVILKMGRGHKLDRTPDGWVLKSLKRREATLTESFLANRGWKFDAMVPFSS
jgi:hypothetical protein